MFQSQKELASITIAKKADERAFNSEVINRKFTHAKGYVTLIGDGTT